MKFASIILLFSIMAHSQNKYDTTFEKGNGNQTATYQETIAYYKMLATSFKTISINEQGLTDSGEPLHTVIFSPDSNFNLKEVGKSKAVLLINNGIHPGEPDGIDATMMLFRDLATNKIAVPKNVVIVTIPVYNIGGALNRGSYSRANQNGPESYGFRGNARNYDLNRDFVKADSRNARSFAAIFQSVNPDVFIDNHVSNGANYQYTFTNIATHHQKLGGDLGKFWQSKMIPALMADLKKKNIESVPYVNIHDEKPDNGFEMFMDYPRYSTGYASMFNTIGSMPETHMLKEYSSRVKVTYEYMVTSITYIEQNFKQIKQLRKDNLNLYKPGNKYTLLWDIDKSVHEEIEFLGYEGSEKPSDISGKPRLFYDENKKFTKKIPHYTTFKSREEIVIPKNYIIPKSWWNVIELLRQNGIEMTVLEKETEFSVESYRIVDFKTSTAAYEGHYVHSNVSVKKTDRKIKFQKGDVVINTQQPGVKYLLETLEPTANDSYFNWNFFDSILQMKEFYSAYVFEDLANELLTKDSELKMRFEEKRKLDSAFKNSGAAQLEWIYMNSPYYEKTHMEYPVYRVMN